MAHQRLAHPLAEQHAPGDDHPADRSVGGDPEQEAHLGDVAERVDTDGHRVDVHDRNVRPNEFEILG